MSNESELQSTPPPAPPARKASEAKLIAGLLGILLGTLGIHKFYLGYTKEGVIQLVAGIITCGLAGVVGLIEGILYLVKTDQEFEETYLKGHKGWF